MPPSDSTSPRVVPTRSGVMYSPDQWAEKRDIITKLYAHEGKSLREVKEYLRDRYDFRPTDRMYQRKIAQWGLEKKHKAPEMRAIIRLARQREAKGLPSIFRIRGKRVDIEDVHRYFKRRGENLDTINVQDSPIPETIEVDTPKALPSVARANNHHDPFEFCFALPYQNPAPYHTPETDYLPSSSTESSSSSSIRSDSVVSTPLVFSGRHFSAQMIPNYPSMAVPIDVTLNDRFSRILIHYTQLFFDVIVPRSYYTSVPANGMKPWRRTVSSWSRATNEASDLLQAGQVAESFKLRNRAMKSVPKHIRNPSPLVLFRYFEIIYTMCREEAYLLGTLNYVLGFANTLLWPGHPIRELTRLLLHPAVRPVIARLAYQGMCKSLDIMNARLGPLHPRILYVLDSRTQTFLDEHQFESAAREARRFHERAEAIRGASSFEACQAIRMLGDSYLGQGLLDQASAEFEKAFDLHHHLRQDVDRMIIGVRAMKGLADIARRKGELHTAHGHLITAMDMAVLGNDDAHIKLIQPSLKALEVEMAIEAERRASIRRTTIGTLSENGRDPPHRAF